MSTHIATTHHDSFDDLLDSIRTLAGSVEHGVGDHVRRYTYSVEVTEAASGKSWEAVHTRT